MLLYVETSCQNYVASNTLSGNKKCRKENDLVAPHPCYISFYLFKYLNFCPLESSISKTFPMKNILISTCSYDLLNCLVNPLSRGDETENQIKVVFVFWVF